MESLLRKLGLKRNIKIKLKTSKQDFVKKLSENIDEKSLSLFSSTFEMFSFSKNKFKGKIENDTFELMKRRTFFNSTNSTTIAKGKFWEEEECLIIEVDINGFHPIYMLFVGFVLVIYMIIFTTTLSSFSKESLIIIPFMFLHSLFMIGIPVFIIYKSVSRLENDLEREFVYIINK